MIVYTNDGEMNTESSEFFIEEVLKKIPYFNELKYTVRHNADDKDSAVITIKNIVPAITNTNCVRMKRPLRRNMLPSAVAKCEGKSFAPIFSTARSNAFEPKSPPNP